MKYTHLRLCTSADNHNMEYIMEQVDDRKFKVSFGRYGSQLLTKLYPISKWDALYKEKLLKGYTDITATKEVSIVKNSEYAEISNSLVKNLINKIMEYANEFIKSSYSIKTADVTQKMVDAAQKIINDMAESKTVHEFNQNLEHLFTVLPRKMKDVSSYLVKSESEYEEVVKREQDLLDTMATKVKQHHLHSHSSISKKEFTILEEMGLEVRPCEEKEIVQIKKHLGESADRFDSAFYVKNSATETVFDDFCRKNHVDNEDIHYFYHGSKNENFWSILCNGLKLRPNAKITGKMFGYGIYFAPLARKSIGYTSLNGSYWAKGTSKEGYLAVFKVAYKHPYDVYSFENKYKSFTYKDVQNLKCDALFAHAGTMLRNDEVVVYTEEQITIRYLIKLK